MLDNFIILLCIAFWAYIKNLVKVEYGEKSFSRIGFAKYS